MYLYEKKDNRIYFYELIPNKEEIKKAKEIEVYGKLDFKTVMVLATNLPENDLVSRKYPLVPNQTWSYNETFQSFAEDYSVTESQLYDYLNRIVERNDLTYIRVSDGSAPKYYCLTSPEYVYIKNNQKDDYKEMHGIIPVSENLFMINKTVNAINNNELLKINLKWLENHKNLFDVVTTVIPSMECVNIEALYNYGVIPGEYTEFEKQLKTSNLILQRVKKKKTMN